VARQFQWLSPDSRQLITLTDRAGGYRLIADATTGLTAPAYRIATEQYAGFDGATVRSVTADAREVVLGLMIEAKDDLTHRQRVGALVRAMRPKAGPGTLICRDEDGQVRTLTCYYSGGLEGAEGRGAKLPGRWVKAAVRFLAEDPWWYGEQQSVSFGLGAATPFFPIPPVRPSGSSVTGRFEVDLSETDTETWPVWTITGPGSDLVLRNETTGQVIAVDVALAGGETLIIDTRPEYLSVRSGAGTNLMRLVQSDPALWPLVEQVNRVTATLTGATSESRIYATFQPRYAGV
jgi:hypothetical protein